MMAASASGNLYLLFGCHKEFTIIIATLEMPRLLIRPNQMVFPLLSLPVAQSTEPTALSLMHVCGLKSCALVTRIAI